jgi:hypothetical protein
VQSSLRIEHVGKAEQVVLVGPSTVVKDEQPIWVAGRRPFTVRKAHRDTAARGFVSGISVCSSAGRRCSC